MSLNRREQALVGLLSAVLNEDTDCEKCGGNGFIPLDDVWMVCQECCDGNWDSALALVNKTYFHLPKEGHVGMMEDIKVDMGEALKQVDSASEGMAKEELALALEDAQESLGFEETCPQCSGQFSSKACVHAYYKDRETGESHGGGDAFCSQKCAEKFVEGEDFEIEEFA